MEHLLGKLPPMLELQGGTLLRLYSQQGGDQTFHVDKARPIEMHFDDVELALQATIRAGADSNGPADKVAAILQSFEHELFGVVHRALQASIETKRPPDHMPTCPHIGVTTCKRAPKPTYAISSFGQERSPTVQQRARNHDCDHDHVLGHDVLGGFRKGLNPLPPLSLDILSSMQLHADMRRKRYPDE